MSNGKNKGSESQGQTSTMAWLLLLSIIIASANNLLYKATLNAFSSPTTNYGFFISQFSSLMYTVQAVIVSAVIIAYNPNSFKDIFKTPASVYVYMGLMDSASATIGAIAGVNCPGMLQTILNQLVIPITMIGAYFFLKSRFESFQIWGSLFILLGAIVASANYLFGGNTSADSDPSVDGVADSGVAEAPSSATTAMVSAAVVLYFLSVIPSAVSNIYKDSKMKEQDMNEVHTSTLVAWWQLWFGFMYLPLMALPALGGLTLDEMMMQLSDGWTCFMGTNPNDPEGDCSNAAYLLMFYIVFNFGYNILMLAITKRGSAVLLVVSQALSLPVTNIAFTLKIFMGKSAEPLSAVDLVGLVLVCIGFLTYSGFGLAHNFMVAQGPVGQMAYVHFEDMSEVIVSTEMALRPDQLVSFLVSSIFQQQTTQQAHRVRTHSMDSALGTGLNVELPEKGRLLEGRGSESASAESKAYHTLDSDASPAPTQAEEKPSQRTATRAALEVARLAVRMLEDQMNELDHGLGSSSEHSSAADMVNCFSSTSTGIKKPLEKKSVVSDV